MSYNQCSIVNFKSRQIKLLRFLKLEQPVYTFGAKDVLGFG